MNRRWAIGQVLITLGIMIAWFVGFLLMILWLVVIGSVLT